MLSKKIILFIIVLILFLIAVACQKDSVTEYRIERYNARLDHILPKDARLEKIAEGFKGVEGPVWSKEGRYLLFSDIPGNSVFKWEEEKGTSLFLKPSGYTGEEPFSGREPGSNGLTFDADGRLVLCEHGDRRISRLEADNTKQTLVDKFEGKRLNSPNDAVYRSNGDLYFTDTPFGLPENINDPKKELDFSGVYHLSADSELTLLTKEIKATNGIAFSPDEKKLYVTDVSEDRPAWLVFNVKEDGTIENRQVLYDAKALTALRKGAPDGLKVDKQGNLFAAGLGGLYIFDADAKLLGFIEIGTPTANCTWGEDGSTLFITADTKIYRIKMSTKGIGF